MLLKTGHQSLMLSDGEIEVHRFAPPDDSRDAIVLLHEGLGSVSMWRDFPSKLCSATGMQVISYSRFGYGLSAPCKLPRPLDYMEREALGPLPELLDQIDANRLCLLGHSDGASIAAIHAAERPDPRLAGIVLIAPHFFTEEFALNAIRQAAHAYNTGDLRLRLLRYHWNNVDCAFRGWNDAWLNPDFAKWDITEYLPAIHTPTLLIQGSKDQYGTVAQLEIAEDKISASVEKQILLGLKHSPHLEQSRRVINLVQQFCKAEMNR